MGEHPKFGIDIHIRSRHSKIDQSTPMFADGTELPLFSGTPIPVIERPFPPKDHSMKQLMLPGIPPVDYDHVLETDRALRRRTLTTLPPAADIFTTPAMMVSAPAGQESEPTGQPDVSAVSPAIIKESRRTTRKRTEKLPPLREALAPYLDIPKLRRLASNHEQLEDALRTGDIPDEISWLLSLLATVLAPIDRDQICSPADVASYFQVKMGHACQEQFCVLCLNTKNRVQKMQTVYQGTIDTATIRVAEVYREPIKLNSSAVVFLHNHPSSDPTPSPEDVLVTRELVAAGNLLGIQPMDHLIIGRRTANTSGWISLKERGLM